MRPQAAALQALLNEPVLQVMPGCGDAMGAHLIQEAGFATAFASGSSISAMRLAMPDMDLLSFPEMRDTVESIIAAAPNVLWLADGDTGYGNALSCAEDDPRLRAPRRRRGADRGQGLAAPARPQRRQTGDRARRRHPALPRRRRGMPRRRASCLLARTDARTSRGFDEALARIKRFRGRGRRHPFSRLAAVGSRRCAPRWRRATASRRSRSTSPAGKHFMPGDAELERIGIRLVVYPQEILAATVHAVRAALVGLKGGPRAADGELARTGDRDPLGRLPRPG